MRPRNFARKAELSKVTDCLRDRDVVVLLNDKTMGTVLFFLETLRPWNLETLEKVSLVLFFYL
jgi:hypothetical protein